MNFMTLRLAIEEKVSESELPVIFGVRISSECDGFIKDLVFFCKPRSSIQLQRHVFVVFSQFAILDNL